MDESFYLEVLNGLYDGVYFVDIERRIKFWNAGAERLSGYSRDEVIGLSCADNILMHVDDAGTNMCLGHCPLAQTMTDGQRREAQVYLHHKDGYRVPVVVRVTPIRDGSGQIVGAVEAFSDNSRELAQAELIEDLRSQALLDHLTEVANRRCLERTIDTKMDEHRRYGTPLGVLFFDIDRFKEINDRFGHEVGDKILRMVAAALQHGFRSFDTLGRWGGDEFAAIVANIDEVQLKGLANRLRAMVESSSVMVNDELIHVTVSVGAAFARHNDTRSSLLSRADSLMYESKLAGRNRVTVELSA